MSTASGDLSSFGVVHPLAKRSMSTGPNQSTTASTLLDVEVYFPKFPSMSTVTLPDVRVLTPFVVPANVERCPTDERVVESIFISLSTNESYCSFYILNLSRPRSLRAGTMVYCSYSKTCIKQRNAYCGYRSHFSIVGEPSASIDKNNYFTLSVCTCGKVNGHVVAFNVVSNIVHRSKQLRIVIL